MQARDGWAYAWITDNLPGAEVTSAVYPTLESLIDNEHWFEGLEVVRVFKGRIQP
jgi:squalene cyclase